MKRKTLCRWLIGLPAFCLLLGSGLITNQYVRIHRLSHELESKHQQFFALARQLPASKVPALDPD